MAKRIILGIAVAILVFFTLSVVGDPLVLDIGASSVGPTGASVLESPAAEITSVEATVDFVQIAWFVSKLLIASIVLIGIVEVKNGEE